MLVYYDLERRHTNASDALRAPLECSRTLSNSASSQLRGQGINSTRKVYGTHQCAQAHRRYLWVRRGAVGLAWARRALSLSHNDPRTKLAESSQTATGSLYLWRGGPRCSVPTPRSARARGVRRGVEGRAAATSRVDQLAALIAVKPSNRGGARLAGDKGGVRIHNVRRDEPV